MGSTPDAQATAYEPIVADDVTYTRFIILGDARTGSTVLQQALNSHPQIMCFREIFHWAQSFVDYDMPGYEDARPRDAEFRSRAPQRFLRERIFRPHPANIRAVGFKFLYPHFWAYPGLVERFVADADLRIVHVRRRNALRALVSSTVAWQTGRWMDDAPRTMPPAEPPMSLFHPLRTVKLFVRHRRRNRRVERTPVRLTPGECREFFQRAERQAAHWDGLFASHLTLTVWYEDLVANPDATHAEVQRFLCVERSPLHVTMQRQNPESLQTLVLNFAELDAEFRDTPYRALLME